MSDGVVGPARGAAHLVRFQDVHDKAAAYMSARDLRRVQQAYVFCAKAHEGQSRLSGEPYLLHPLAVAEILAEMRADPVTVVAGLLHDVLEDTPVPADEVARLFGPEVAHVVDGVTKLSKLAFSTREEAQAQSFRKMILAMADDIRVVLVKLADRLHNMRTLGFLPPDRAKLVAQETRDIYAPLARRLGMGRMRDELEDLAFRHAEPARHAALEAELEARRRVDEGFIRRVEERLRESIVEAGIVAEVAGRRKSLASIDRKLKARGIGIDEVYDYIAFRILVETVHDCYAALGAIHSTWTPIQARFKDFIATPKPNGYRSLHTTVLSEEGHPFEVQIRTADMHRVSEEGVAAHWSYKEGEAASRSEVETFAWLRNLVETLSEHADPHEFMQAVKMDLYGDEVFCFTPRGEVKVLPAGSTPLDFAYAIHTEVGHRCVGARIDGSLVPLRTRLQHGNRVEILTSPTQHPRRDWLQVAATSRARSKIRQWFNAREREEAVVRGRAILDREARRHGTTARRALQDKAAIEALRQLSFRDSDDFLVALAHERVAPAALLSRVAPEAAPPEPAPAAASRPAPSPAARRARRGPPVVAGDGTLLTTLARCCNPVRGEPIVGYVTRGRGVSIHRQGCRSLAALPDAATRHLPVTWNPDAQATFDVRLRVDVEDRAGILGAVTGAVSALETNIREAAARAFGSRRGVITLVVEVRDAAHLERVRRTLLGIEGVRHVENRS